MSSKAISRKQYDKLTPKQQGIVAYMQGAWNKEIPKLPDYERGSDKWDEYCEGETLAMFSCIDGDDE
jgi:hypothetical protein